MCSLAVKTASGKTKTKFQDQDRCCLYQDQDQDRRVWDQDQVRQLETKAKTKTKATNSIHKPVGFYSPVAPPGPNAPSSECPPNVSK